MRKLLRSRRSGQYNFRKARIRGRCLRRSESRRGLRDFGHKTYNVSEFWRILVTPSFFCRRSATALFAVFFIAFTTAVYAQNSPGPQPVPLPPPIVAPADTPYPGTISLLVDVTNVTDRVLNVHETIPVKGRRHHAALPRVASRDALAIEPSERTCRPGHHGEWQTHRLDARSREHVRLPCRCAAGCNDAGHQLPVPGPAGSETRAAFPRSSPTLPGTACCSIRRDTSRGISNSNPRSVCRRDGNSLARWT